MKKFFGVIGNPIAQSISPQMHNNLFVYYGIDAHYHPFLVERGKLSEAVQGLKALGVAGFNVTVPFKTDIIPLLDWIDPLALEIGAVNTVVNKDGILLGYNTDGPGFLKSLEEELTLPKQPAILIIGAGGAARAIFFTLEKIGPSAIDLCNRSLEKAQSLAAEAKSHVPSNALTLDEAERRLNDYDLIIQTTTVGMYPEIGQLPLDPGGMNKPFSAADIIYNPYETEFLKRCRLRGAKTVNGIGMFVYQGALAFELWTGVEPDSERMRRTVLNQLGGATC
ncbi:shikimate dehydrogenase [Neobacillus notoginsengisoli]|uniref:Shikimate dehydrogenase (NADP(+)) n=1 Tax=Neobacillus notoginsengisoli TaxID=1578198 RepID=A0A417YUJ4_9BACI|nr:shikimate dehydrogenase [Neobacillus notoginsengisoli]RHW40977.1 shikimate dehydrogenase [Neobacillus notoginsengisoli]